MSHLIIVYFDNVFADFLDLMYQSIISINDLFGSAVIGWIGGCKQYALFPLRYAVGIYHDQSISSASSTVL